MSIDWNELREKVLKDVDFVLREDLESLKRESGRDLNELWNSIKSAWTTYRRDYAPRVDKDVDESIRSRFQLARLMIATAIQEYLFSMDMRLEDDLNNCIVSEALNKVFKTKGVSLSERSNITTKENEDKWMITDEGKENAYLVRGKNEKLNIYEVKHPGIVDSFNSNEMALVEEFEEFKFVEVLSILQIVNYIARKDAKLYGFVKTYLKRGYANLDAMFDGRGIQRDILVAVNEKYGRILGRIEEAIIEYIKQKPGKFLLVMDEMEEAVKLANGAEEERVKITEMLNQKFVELEQKFTDAESVRQEKEGSEDKLREIEQELQSKESEKEELLSRISRLESENAGTTQKYAEIENACESSLKEIEARWKQLEIREKELKEGIEKYEGELQEANRRIFERELGKIEELKEELRLKEAEVENKRDTLKYEKDELDEKLKAIKSVIEGGEAKRYVTRDIAKIHEMNYIGRFDVKANELPKTLSNPIDEREYRINAWGRHQKFDEKDKLFKELEMSYAEVEEKIPLNLRSRYVVSEKKYKLFGKEQTKIVIEAVVLNHWKDYAEIGLDTKSFTLSELMSVLTRYIDRAELGQYFHVLGIASVTGWDERVLDYIQSDEFHRNFVNRHVSICLVDLETGELLYNKLDDRIKDFIELFEPLFDTEKLEKCKESIKEELDRGDYVVLEDISKRGVCDEIFAKKTFYDLECEGFGKVVRMKDIGTVLRRD